MCCQESSLDAYTSANNQLQELFTTRKGLSVKLLASRTGMGERERKKKKKRGKKEKGEKKKGEKGKEEREEREKGGRRKGKAKRLKLGVEGE